MSLGSSSSCSNIDEGQCAICLDAHDNPVTLPCHHKYCSGCLEGWRSRYDIQSTRTCPECRSSIPPSREMMARLETSRSLLDLLKARLNSSEPLPVLSLLSDMERIREFPQEEQQDYLRLVYQKRVRKIEVYVRDIEASLGEVKDGHGLLQEENVSFEILPQEVLQAVGNNEMSKIVEWLGPPPIALERLNSRTSPQTGDCSLVNATVVFDANSSIMEMLLQWGANVDPKDCFGITPLCNACRMLKGDAPARLLLQWGASKDPMNGALDLAQRAQEHGKTELSQLLQTRLGGRRCELVGLSRCAELNGLTGIAGRYDADLDQYTLTTTMEGTNQEVQVAGVHLKRRDRTPEDPGDCSHEIDRPRKAIKTEHSLSPTTKSKRQLLIEKSSIID
jgi:hypothetical protein